MHEVIVPQGFERYPALWNDPHYLSSFSLGVRVIAGSNPATPTIQISQQNRCVESALNSESGPEYPTTVGDFAGTLARNLCWAPPLTLPALGPLRAAPWPGYAHNEQAFEG